MRFNSTFLHVLVTMNTFKRHKCLSTLHMLDLQHLTALRRNKCLFITGNSSSWNSSDSNRGLNRVKMSYFITGNLTHSGPILRLTFRWGRCHGKLGSSLYQSTDKPSTRTSLCSFSLSSPSFPYLHTGMEEGEPGETERWSLRLSRAAANVSGVTLGIMKDVSIKSRCYKRAAVTDPSTHLLSTTSFIKGSAQHPCALEWRAPPSSAVTHQTSR